ncbi:MAG: hypothetical protein J6S67_20835 [Methanobrevibacter sp.]|nr:hypothetical protein [Methanobrevibacter sp.]
MAQALSGAGAAGSAAGGIGSALSNVNWGSVLGNLGNVLGKYGNMSSSANEDNDTKQAYQAYQTFLGSVYDKMANELEARAEKYDQKLQDQFNIAEPQFQQEAYTQLPELQKLVEDVQNQNTETQRGDLRRINAILAQQGVRGGQAAILANRAQGETTRDTLRDINNLVYNEAANRQNARLNYYGDKALTPWKAMSSAYGQSMVGANNALSAAQGHVYENAYNKAMNNYVNAYQAPKKSGSKFGNALSGAGQGAVIGSAFGPVGAAVGGIGGGVLGYFK